MADIRRSIVKIIQVVSFLVYLYNVISSYMKYDTMTNVNRIRKREELPAIGYAFCVNFIQILRSNYSYNEEWFLGIYEENYLKAATYGIDELRINLTMNRRKIFLRDSPYTVRQFKCWPFDPPFEFSLEDEIFVVETEYQYLTMVINRNLNHIVRHFIQDVYSIHLSSNAAFFLETIVIKQLSFPYKTNCKYYNVSQDHCIVHCLFVSYGNRKSIYKRCLKKCSEGDCIKLIDYKRIGLIDSEQRMQSCFGSDYLSVITNPLLPLPLFIQQIVGLITMFFEIAISDVADYSFSKLRQFIANILKYVTKRKRKYYIIASIKHIFIYFGCMAHIIFSIHIYLQYRTSTESFVGSPMTDYIPTFGICFDMGNQWNATMTLEDIGKENPSFREIVNVSSSSVQVSNYSAHKYYMNKKPCSAFSIAENGYTRFNREMVRVEFVKDLPYRLSIDFFVKYPMTYYIFRAGKTLNLEFMSQIIDLISLPSPFESNCVDYKSLGMPSRRGCRNSCLLDWYRNYSNQLPYNVINYKYYDMEMGSDYPNYSICHGKCQNVDCHETKLNLVQFNFIKHNTFPGFTILNPTNIISSNLIPNQSLVDFITFTTSILTLWFGLSGISIIEVLGSTKITKKYKPEISPLMWIILICCFNYHMYQILSGYFSYQVVSSVKLGESGSIHLPSVSIAFEFNNRTSRSSVYGISDTQRMSPFQLNQKFHESIDLVPVIELPNQQNWETPIKQSISKITNITYTSIVSNLKVTTFDLEALNRNMYTFVTNTVKYQNIYIRLQLDKLYFRTWGRSEEHSDIHSFVFHNHRYHRLDVNDRTHILPKYHLQSYLQKSVLLKHPYSSECIEYSDPLTTDSYESCMIRNHQQMYGMIPYSITVPATYNYSRMPPDDEIVKWCHRLYSVHPFCEMISYSFVNVREDDVYRPETLRIRLPRKITSCILSPKTTILDLIILIGDTFGLWLGISIFLILEKIISYTKCVNFDDFLVAV